MKEFREYLEQVGLRGQSISIGAKKMADKLGETLESIVSNWKISKKQNLCVEFRNEKNKREWISGLADWNASYAPYLSDLKFCGYRNQEFPLELFKF